MSEIRTLHEPFAKFLRDRKIPFVRARSDRESTIAVGHPDFSLFACNSVLFVEFKSKTGDLSAGQKQRIAELEAAGTKVHVIRDLNSAIELVNAWHSTLREVPTDEKPRKIVVYGGRRFEERNGALIRISEP